MLLPCYGVAERLVDLLLQMLPASDSPAIDGAVLFFKSPRDNLADSLVLL